MAFALTHDSHWGHCGQWYSPCWRKLLEWRKEPNSCCAILLLLLRRTSPNDLCAPVKEMFVNLRLPWVLKWVTSVKAGAHLRIESGILTQTAWLWFRKTIYAQLPSFLFLDGRDMAGVTYSSWRDTDSGTYIQNHENYSRPWIGLKRGFGLFFMAPFVSYA